MRGAGRPRWPARFALRAVTVAINARRAPARPQQLPAVPETVALFVELGVRSEVSGGAIRTTYEQVPVAALRPCHVGNPPSAPSSASWWTAASFAGGSCQRWRSARRQSQAPTAQWNRGRARLACRRRRPGDDQPPLGSTQSVKRATDAPDGRAAQSGDRSPGQVPAWGFMSLRQVQVRQVALGTRARRATWQVIERLRQHQQDSVCR
jgi:hypothetical protein